jgi:ABC-2 type transport system permease protein
MVLVAAVILPAVGLDGWRLPAPVSPAAAVIWLAAFAGAVVLSSALTVVVHIGLLWTVGGEGVPVLIGTAAVLLGGLVIPLPLFPDWAQPWLIALPFAGILDLPADAVLVVVHQAAWSAVLIAGGRLVLAVRLRRMAVHGG